MPTGGLGTGGGVGNQGALALDDGGDFLFAVNAGSNDISVLRTRPGGLTLVDRVASGGVSPISLTVSGDLLYALNAGSGSAPGSIQQIQFDPAGHVLVVTEKATNSISTYTVGRDGIASGPNVQPSNSATPFAFDTRGRLIVSEAFGGAASALSSYDVGRDGVLETISPSVFAAQERAACWVVGTRNGRYALAARVPVVSP